ncbi:MAG: sigma-54 factor interaction domain-containing protein, partial [Desulfuromonadales bacterium]|nr:sigma-54 factor interaction domain-containing protein [Desulfuromonadales bacterium]NIS39353.1 sigma-54 factor interaction domain-containing protein [Desulfuromonadales bacterium]
RQFGLVGSSPGMLEVFRKIKTYSVSDAAVLVTGETGTGKELIARALHEQSMRRRGPFVAVNCSAISDELLESELFGHEKGAFTGALKMHRGRFERADGGTIFLDEIGDMPPATQVKLLRVLETGRIERVGSEQEVPVDVRVVCATNVPLEEAVGKGVFRS